MIYLTSDIHGCFDQFKQMLEYIQFGETDYLYIIGDVLGRGEQPIPLLRYVMKQQNMKLIRGNHEQAFLWNMDKNTSHLSDEEIHRLWLEHSGAETRDQFLALSIEEQKETMEYLKNCPYYKILGKNILVHAGIRSQGMEYETLEELMEKQDKNQIIWGTKDLYGVPLELKDPEVRVFFGHIFSLIIRNDLGQPLDSTEIWKDKNRIGMDCGYAFGGKMVMYCLDTDREFYLTSSGDFYNIP